MDAVSGRVAIGVIAGIGLVHKGHLDRLACDLLHGLGERGDLHPILLVGRCDMQSQQVCPSVSTAMCTSEPLRFLEPS